MEKLELSQLMQEFQTLSDEGLPKAKNNYAKPKRIKKYPYIRYGDKVVGSGYDFGQLILIPSKSGANIFGRIFRKKDNILIYSFVNTPVKNIKTMIAATKELSELADWNLIKDVRKLSKEQQKELKEGMNRIMNKYGGSY